MTRLLFVFSSLAAMALTADSASAQQVRPATRTNFGPPSVYYSSGQVVPYGGNSGSLITNPYAAGNAFQNNPYNGPNAVFSHIAGSGGGFGSSYGNRNSFGFGQSFYNPMMPMVLLVPVRPTYYYTPNFYWP